VVPPQLYHQYILSLARVKKKHHVTFDSSNKNQFVVHKKDGSTWCFKESRQGLYYLETGRTSTILMNTIEENKSSYSNHNYSRTTLSRKIQNIIGRPRLWSYRTTSYPTVLSLIRTSSPQRTSLDQTSGHSKARQGGLPPNTSELSMWTYLSTFTSCLQVQDMRVGTPSLAI
jgi:hypothetical protein